MCAVRNMEFPMDRLERILGMLLSQRWHIGQSKYNTSLLHTDFSILFASFVIFINYFDLLVIIYLY